MKYYVISDHVVRDMNLLLMINIWVKSRRCGCLVTRLCYQMIANPGNKTVAPSWPDPYIHIFAYEIPEILGLFDGSLKPFTFTGKALIMGDQWVIWCCEWNEMVCHQIDWQVHFFFIIYKPNNLVYSEPEKDLYGIIRRNGIIGTTDIMHWDLNK